MLRTAFKVLTISCVSLSLLVAGIANHAQADIDFTPGDFNGNGIPDVIDPTSPMNVLYSSSSSSSGGGPIRYAPLTRKGKIGIALGAAAILGSFASLAGVVLLPTYCDVGTIPREDFYNGKAYSSWYRTKCGLRSVLGMKTGESRSSVSSARNPQQQLARYSGDPRVSQTSVRSSKGSSEDSSLGGWIRGVVSTARSAVGG